MKLSTLLPFKLGIEGVECRLCAQEVERLFLQSKDFYGVKFVPLMGTYEKGYLTCRLVRGGANMSVYRVNDLLKSKGFVCSTIEGQFIGMFTEHEGRRVFVTQDHQEIFLLSHTAHVYEDIGDDYWQQLPKNTLERINAKAVRRDDDTWWIAL